MYTIESVPAAVCCLLAATVVFAADVPTFVDASDETSTRFVHQGLPENVLVCMGSGGGWGDFDGDGDPDLYVTSQVGANHLLRNDGDDGFVDVAVESGVDLPSDPSSAVLWGDYDNDGDADLYVGAVGSNHLFRNDGLDSKGVWQFTDVTDAAGVAGTGRTATAVYGDYDNDGWLDMYVANHITNGVQWPQAPDPAVSDQLYRNVPGPDGGRTFVDVAPDVFGQDVLSLGIAHSAGFMDYDNDGDLDVLMINEVFRGLLESNGLLIWRNDGAAGNSWSFTEVSQSVGVNVVRDHPMGLAIGDYDGDGWLDFSVSDIGPTRLFHNEEGVFIEQGLGSGVGRDTVPGEEYDEVGWGLVFADFNLDAMPDLYVATGRCNQVDKAYHPNPLFVNEDGLTFADAGLDYGAGDDGRSNGVAVADYDADGDVDLFVINYDDGTYLFRNDTLLQNQITLHLVGTRSNRDAIGARVHATAAALPPIEAVVQTGSSHGNTHQLDLHLGLAGASQIDTLVIDWPSGAQTILSNVAGNQRLTIGEPGLLISGIASIGAGTSSQFTATRFAEDGTSEDVTDAVEWTLDASADAAVDASGMVQLEDIEAAQYATLLAVIDGQEATLTVLLQPIIADDDTPEDDPEDTPVDDPPADETPDDDPPDGGDEDPGTNDGTDNGDIGSVGDGPTLPGPGDASDDEPGTVNDDDNGAPDAPTDGDAGSSDQGTGANDDSASGNADEANDGGAGPRTGGGGGGGGAACGAGILGLGNLLPFLVCSFIASRRLGSRRR